MKTVKHSVFRRAACALFAALAVMAAAQSLNAAPAGAYKPEKWNLEARKKFTAQRFGIFIHWGLYANYAQGEWYLQQSQLDEKAYSRMKDGFYPSKFDAKEWVKVFKNAGAKYVTITSRHHDGFSLWPTKADDGYNIMNTPFKRDILGELATACREAGLQLNFYYSIMDWHRKDYPAGSVAKRVLGNQKGDYASYKKFMKAQITELIDSYRPGNIWFDGEWDHAEFKKGKWHDNLDWHFDELYDLIHSKNVLVANNNHRPIRPKEDIQLFERDLPGENKTGFSKNQSVIEDRPIEQCDVIQKGVWGYRIGEKSFRTPQEVCTMICRAAAKDTNLLMNIGPDGSGRLPAKAVEIMAEVGKWMKANGDVIYGTRGAGIAKEKNGVEILKTKKGGRVFTIKAVPGRYPEVQRTPPCEVSINDAWIKGETDKDPVSYKTGEPMKFTLTLMDVKGEIPADRYFLDWKCTDDFGKVEKGRVPLTKKPFVHVARLDKPGFVRLEASVVDKSGTRYVRKFTGDATTPEGRRAMNAFERRNKRIFFDGGAGADVCKLKPSGEPADFDKFWKNQFARLGKVPMKDARVELPCKNPKVRIFAVRVDCAGLRPVTGYLSVPKAVDTGARFPCRLETHGYSGDYCRHEAPSNARENEIVFNINAHGLKLPAFGATAADTKALRWEIRSNGSAYAFDPKQNEDPETAYFNGMVLRVKRALQYLKTVKGWNGRDLIASGGSQGGLQTIWAAACGEGVTRAESAVTWCCDMIRNNARRERRISSDGWYIAWTKAMGYYDAAIFAKRIPATCKTVITRAGLGDYCCPPAGLAMMWNNMTCPRKIVWVQGSQHGYVPPEYKGRDTVREKN